MCGWSHPLLTINRNKPLVRAYVCTPTGSRFGNVHLNHLVRDESEVWVLRHRGCAATLVLLSDYRFDPIQSGVKTIMLFVGRAPITLNGHDFSSTDCHAHLRIHPSRHGVR